MSYLRVARRTQDERRNYRVRRYTVGGGVWTMSRRLVGRINFTGNRLADPTSSASGLADRQRSHLLSADVECRIRVAQFLRTSDFPGVLWVAEL